MIVYKCDSCKSVVKNRDQKVSIGIGWDNKEFCLACGKKLLTKQGRKEIINAKKTK